MLLRRYNVSDATQEERSDTWINFIRRFADVNSGPRKCFTGMEE